MAATCDAPAQANMWTVGSALARRLPPLPALQAAALVAAVVVVHLLRSPLPAQSSHPASLLSLAPLPARPNRRYHPSHREILQNMIFF